MILAFPAALSACALVLSSTAPTQEGASGAAPSDATAGAPPQRVERAGIESALDAAVGWLVRQQEADGRFSFPGSAARCPESFDKRVKAQADYDLGLTGLSVLVLARARAAQGGETTLATAGALDRGVAWLVANQKDDGSIGERRAFMYSEAMAACALVAAFEIDRDPAVKAAAQKSVAFVQAAQRPSPTGQGAWGWRYASRQDVERSGGDEPAKRELFDSDTSVTAWCVRALRAARDAGLAVDDTAFDGAAAYARWVTARDGQVGYMDPKGAGLPVTGVNDHFVYHPAAMAALAVLVRLDAGEGRHEEALAGSMRHVLADVPRAGDDRLAIDYYYWHHGVLALGRMRASGAEAWTDAAVAHLVALQEKSGGSCREGAWTKGDRWAYAGGALYATALNALTLADALGWE